MLHVPEQFRPKPLLERRNQLDPRLLNISAFDWGAQHGTSPRAQMLGTQLGQRLNIRRPTERRIQTGSERDYGKYTFKIQSPGRITILKKIDRYGGQFGEDPIRHVPQSIVIYEDYDKKEIGMLDMVDFCTNHPKFGFDYKNTEAYDRIREKATFNPGEVFKESPSITPNGGFMYGLELPTAALTHPGVAEDGTIISEYAADQMSYPTYETRVASCGPKDIPLHLYKKANGVYGVCPDIGEKIREDGLLFATRKADQECSIFDQSPHALQTYYPFFDNRVYAPPGGTIIDIQVIHDNYSRSERVPLHTDDQLMKYYNATETFYKNIIRAYWEIRKNPRYAQFTFQPAFHDLLRKAMNLTETENQARPVLLHKKAKLDDWRIVFTIRYENRPGVGSKLAGLFGDKGIVVAVWPNEKMPVDKWGNRAHVLVDSNSTVARSILGRAYQPYFTGAIRDFVQARKQAYGIEGRIGKDYFLKPENRRVGEAIAIDLGELYRCFSNGEYRTQSYWYDHVLSEDEQLEHVAHVMQKGIYLFIRTDNEKETPKIFHDIRDKFPPNIGTLSLVDYYDNQIETVENIQIADNYYILLDKVADTAAAVNSPKLQQHGIIARLSEQDRYSTPGRPQSTRSHGESEVRNYADYMDEEALAELMDRANNRDSMAAQARGLMVADKPTRIERIVPRPEIPYDPRPLRIVNSYANGDGWEYAWQPFVPNWDKEKMKEVLGDRYTDTFTSP